MDNTIHLKVFGFSYGTTINATCGCISNSKGFEFPNCKIIPLDTNGLGDINTDFAKIIDAVVGVISNDTKTNYA